MLYNIYLDESNNAYKSKKKGLAVGAVYCQKDCLEKVKNDIKKIKSHNGINQYQEVKWTKISPSNAHMYVELLDYFACSNDLRYIGFVLDDNVKNTLTYSEHRMNIINLTSIVITGIITTVGIKNQYHTIADFDDAYGHRIGNQLKQAINEVRSGLMTEYSHVDSKDSVLIQLADIINGALTMQFNDSPISSGKTMVHQRLYDLYLSNLNERYVNYVPEKAGNVRFYRGILKMIKKNKLKFFAIPIVKTVRNDSNG